MLTKLLLAFFFFISCDLRSVDEVEDKRLQKKLISVFEKAEKIEDEQVFTFKMDSVTKFRWDKMYAFTYSYSNSEIEAIIGCDWDVNAHTMGEKDNLFLFVKGNKVVSFVMFSSSNYDIKDLYFHSSIHDIHFYKPYIWYYTPQNALFSIYKNYDGGVGNKDKYTFGIDPTHLLKEPLSKYTHIYH